MIFIKPTYLKNISKALEINQELIAEFFYLSFDLKRQCSWESYSKSKLENNWFINHRMQATAQMRFLQNYLRDLIWTSMEGNKWATDPFWTDLMENLER